MASAGEKRVCIGRIVGAHGVKGWVRITSYTDNPENVGAFGPVSDETGRSVFELEVKGLSKAHVLVRIPGISDRDAAEALRGTSLFVPRDRLPTLESDEFYNEDLIGVPVETMDGKELGAVLSVQDFGTGPLLEVGENRGRTVLVPFTRDVVPVVDFEERIILVEPPEGLFDPVAKDDGEGAHDER